MGRTARLPCPRLLPRGPRVGSQWDLRRRHRRPPRLRTWPGAWPESVWLPYRCADRSWGEELLKNFVGHHDAPRRETQVVVRALQHAGRKEIFEGGTESFPVRVVGVNAFRKPETHEEFLFTGIGRAFLDSHGFAAF